MLSLVICLLEADMGAADRRRYFCPACHSELDYHVPRRLTDPDDDRPRSAGSYHRCPKHGAAYTVSPSTGIAGGDIAREYGVHGRPAPEGSERAAQDRANVDRLTDRFGDIASSIRSGRLDPGRLDREALMALARELEKRLKRGEDHPEVAAAVHTAIEARFGA